MEFFYFSRRRHVHNPRQPIKAAHLRGPVLLDDLSSSAAQYVDPKKELCINIVCFAFFSAEIYSFCL